MRLLWTAMVLQVELTHDLGPGVTRVTFGIVIAM